MRIIKDLFGDKASEEKFNPEEAMAFLTGLTEKQGFGIEHRKDMITVYGDLELLSAEDMPDLTGVMVNGDLTISEELLKHQRKLPMTVSGQFILSDAEPEPEIDHKALGNKLVHKGPLPRK